jgi:hypothetical protein
MADIPRKARTLVELLSPFGLEQYAMIIQNIGQEVQIVG